MCTHFPSLTSPPAPNSTRPCPLARPLDPIFSLFVPTLSTTRFPDPSPTHPWIAP